MSDDKYMRAADEAWTWFVNRRSDDLSGLADVLREELERPEPLEVGVTHRFMHANKFMVEVCFDGAHIYTTVTSFPVIHDGEVRDE